MTHIRTKQSLIFSLLILIPFFAQAALPQWQIIPTESQLSFTGIQNNAPISGEFKIFTGQIAFDPNNVKNSHVNIVINIQSLSISYAQLKETLLASDWLNAKNFPKAGFNSTAIEKIDEKTYHAKGNLTIRDKTVPILLTFTVEQAHNNKATATGDAIIKRTQFGVGQREWANTKNINDDVKIHFKVVAVKE